MTQVSQTVKRSIAMFTLCGAMTAQAQTPDGVASQIEALQREVSELRAESKEAAKLRDEVRALRGEKEETWLSQRRAEEVKALIREVLADADARASLLADAPTAGHNGKKFFLGSADGKFLMNFGGRIQTRYVANTRDRGAAAANTVNDEFESGFTLRRVKPTVDGYVGDPRFGYKLVIAADRNNTGSGLEEAVVDYKFSDQLTLAVGRFKAPFLHEELVSSGRQQAAERSVINEFFTTGFSEGVSIAWQGEDLRMTAMFNDGQNQGEVSSNAGTRDFQNDTADYALTARIDWRVMGGWKQYDDFSSWSNEDMAFFIGAAIHYEAGESGDAQGTARRTFTQDLNSDGDTADTVGGLGETFRYVYDSFLLWTVDVSMEYNGLNLYAAVIGQHFNGNGAAQGTAAAVTSFGNVDINALGVVVQGGYFIIPNELEPFVRYEWLTLDRIPAGIDAATALEDLNIVTVGANYYFRRHDAKFTADVVWVLNPLTSTSVLGTGVSGLGLLSDVINGDTQVAVRLQFQLQF